MLFPYCTLWPLYKLSIPNYWILPSFGCWNVLLLIWLCSTVQMCTLYTARHWTELNCTALHCTALHFSGLYCTVLHFTLRRLVDLGEAQGVRKGREGMNMAGPLLHNGQTQHTACTLNYTAQPNIAMHCNALQCSASHCNALYPVYTNTSQ